MIQSDETNMGLPKPEGELPATSDSGLNKMSTEMNKEARANKVMELHFKGYNQEAIAKELGISQPTVSRDLSYIESEIYRKREDMSKLVFVETMKALGGMDALLPRLCDIAERYHPIEGGMQAASLAVKLYKEKLAVLTGKMVTERWQQVVADVTTKEQKLQETKTPPEIVAPPKTQSAEVN